MVHISKIQSIENMLGKPEVLKQKQGVRLKGDKRVYCTILSSFDIETTRIETIDNSVMYIWQWYFYNLKKDEPIITVYGRTWQEYTDFVQRLKDWLSSCNERNIYMVRLVHNLSYEFQFLSAFYPYGENEVFAIQKRKVAKADSYGFIEDRCTYIHSNLSLDKYAKEWGASHLKQSGIEFDYSKPRFSWTEMTEAELKYCEYDVLACLEAYVNEMKYYKDTLYTVPLLPRGM